MHKLVSACLPTTASQLDRIRHSYHVTLSLNETAFWRLLRYRFARTVRQDAPHLNGARLRLLRLDTTPCRARGFHTARSWTGPPRDTPTRSVGLLCHTHRSLTSSGLFENNVYRACTLTHTAFDSSYLLYAAPFPHRQHRWYAASSCAAAFMRCYAFLPHLAKTNTYTFWRTGYWSQDADGIYASRMRRSGALILNGFYTLATCRQRSPAISTLYWVSGARGIITPWDRCLLAVRLGRVLTIPQTLEERVHLSASCLLHTLKAPPHRAREKSTHILPLSPCLCPGLCAKSREEEDFSGHTLLRLTGRWCPSGHRPPPQDGAALHSMRQAFIDLALPPLYL